MLLLPLGSDLLIFYVQNGKEGTWKIFVQLLSLLRIAVVQVDESLPHERQIAPLFHSQYHNDLARDSI